MDEFAHAISEIDAARPLLMGIRSPKQVDEARRHLECALVSVNWLVAEYQLADYYAHDRPVAIPGDADYLRSP